MKLKQKAVSLISRTKTGKKMISSQYYRIMVSAMAAFVFNLFYALYHCVLGIINCSLWFISMGAFYGVLAMMRFSAVLFDRKHRKSFSNDMDVFVMKFSGVLLIVLGVVLAVVNYISLSQDIATKYEKITMITIATYTFCKIVIAIVRAVKQRKHSSSLLRMIRNINYAEVSASILTLQRSMLVSFDSMDKRQVRFMNAMTGAAVCLFVLVLGLSMIAKKRKEVEVWQNQNL